MGIAEEFRYLTNWGLGYRAPGFEKFIAKVPVITYIINHALDMSRTQPNIIITGTPGVGKTSHCELLAQDTGLKHLSINKIVKERGCHDGWDEEFKSWVVDEDKARGLNLLDQERKG